MELRNLVLFLSFINIISARITVPIRKLSTMNSSPVPSSQSPHHKMDVNRTHHVVKERLYNFFNVQYFGNISVGTPEQISIVILDTGSNELWFSGSNCTNCKDEILFDCSASSTCTNTTTPGRIDYDQGSVIGTYASDLVSIDGSFSVRYPFILATQKANLNTEANGVMGLGNWPGYKNLVDLAYDNGAISDKVFSFYFDSVTTPNHSLLSTESYLTLGYIHEKHAGDIVWLPITDRTSWTTDVIGMTIGSNNIDISSDPGSDKVLFDTGTSIMLIADPVYEAVINILESAGCFSPQTGALYRGGYICPCSEEQTKSYPEISVFTRGVEIILRSEAYLISAYENDEKGMCHVALRSNKWLGQDRVQILGDAYFRQNYVVFSKRNQTIGVTHKRNHLLTPVPDRLYVWTGIIGLGLGLLISLAILYIEWQNSKEEQLNPPENNVKGEVELVE